MGYFVGLPLGGAAEKDCQVRFGKNMTFQVETRAPHLPAEWALQSGIQLTWPHAGTACPSAVQRPHTDPPRRPATAGSSRADRPRPVGTR